jgi:hypothetical protein
MPIAPSSIPPAIVILEKTVQFFCLAGGFIYHSLIFFCQPLGTAVGLICNLLLQVQLGYYVKAGLWGSAISKFFSLLLGGLMESIYLTEIGVHFKSSSLTFLAIGSLVLTLCCPVLYPFLVVLNLVSTSWICLREYQNDPKYCGSRLTSVFWALLEGSFYGLGWFLPNPLRWLRWIDLARGAYSARVITRVNSVNFNTRKILDISFLWKDNVVQLPTTPKSTKDKSK